MERSDHAAVREDDVDSRRWLGHIERMQDTAIRKKKDVVRKAVCNKTKRKTKNEMAG